MGRQDRDALSQSQQIEVRPSDTGCLRRLGKMTSVRIKAILREDCIRTVPVATMKPAVVDSGKSRWRSLFGQCSPNGVAKLSTDERR
ncbi:MAG: hypothetical protein DWI00_10500 [Planctomycetota bacterium]|nr:MAG: hypothetical protein DWI00_10500 [Planctomycetota bacterium]